jgi:hypothetical protein
MHGMGGFKIIDAQQAKIINNFKNKNFTSLSDRECTLCVVIPGYCIVMQLYCGR